MRPSPKIYLNLGLGVRPSPGLGSCSVLWFHSQGFSLTRVSALLESPRRGNEPLPAHLGEKKKKKRRFYFLLVIFLWKHTWNFCFEKLIICTGNSQFHQYAPSPWKPTSLSDADIKCGFSSGTDVWPPKRLQLHPRCSWMQLWAEIQPGEFWSLPALPEFSWEAQASGQSWIFGVFLLLQLSQRSRIHLEFAHWWLLLIRC